MPHTVLVVDDNALARQSLAALLSTASDLELVAEASIGQAAVLQAVALRPDTVLMHMHLRTDHRMS